MLRVPPEHGRPVDQDAIAPGGRGPIGVLVGGQAADRQAVEVSGQDVVPVRLVEGTRPFEQSGQAEVSLGELGIFRQDRSVGLAGSRDRRPRRPGSPRTPSPGTRGRPGRRRRRGPSGWARNRRRCREGWPRIGRTPRPPQPRTKASRRAWKSCRRRADSSGGQTGNCTQSPLFDAQEVHPSPGRPVPPGASGPGAKPVGPRRRGGRSGLPRRHNGERPGPAGTGRRHRTRGQGPLDHARVSRSAACKILRASSRLPS